MAAAAVQNIAHNLEITGADPRAYERHCPRLPRGFHTCVPAVNVANPGDHRGRRRRDWHRRRWRIQARTPAVAGASSRQVTEGCVRGADGPDGAWPGLVRPSSEWRAQAPVYKRGPTLLGFVADGARLPVTSFESLKVAVWVLPGRPEDGMKERAGWRARGRRGGRRVCRW